LELIALLDPDVGFDPSPRGRRIRYALANDEGVVNQELTERPNFFYEGRSVFDLRTRVENDCNIVGITLCVLAGKNARPIPLVADLPMNQDPMDIIVYTNGSPGENSAFLSSLWGTFICFSPFQHNTYIKFSACNVEV
jgi:hypothetical protein